MNHETCPHCGMTWAEWKGEYECGSYPAGSSVVRATACAEISRLQAELAQVREVVVPELMDDDYKEVKTVRAEDDLYFRVGYNLAASRAHSIPASRVLKDGEVAIPEKSFRDLQHFHEIRDAAIHAVAHGLSNGPFRTKSLLMLRDALRAQGKEDL